MFLLGDSVALAPSDEEVRYYTNSRTNPNGTMMCVADSGQSGVGGRRRARHWPQRITRQLGRTGTRRFLFVPSFPRAPLLRCPLFPNRIFFCAIAASHRSSGARRCDALCRLHVVVDLRSDHASAVSALDMLLCFVCVMNIVCKHCRLLFEVECQLALSTSLEGNR
jgi:hypothetical protein